MGEIKEGQKVKLTINTDEGLEKELECTIKNIYADRLSLNYPEEIFKYIEYFEEGEDVPVKIFTPLGIKSFSALILDSPYEEDFTIEYIENANEIQRREYVRVQLCVKVFIEKEDKNNVIAYTIDVSGGGIKFMSEEKFNDKEKIKIVMYMPDDKAIQAKGVIVHNQFIPKNQHIVSFSEIDEKDRDRIIKKCFEIQLSKLEE